MLGADTDLPAAAALLGGRTVGAVTIGQALHWMDHEALFQKVALLIRHGGGVAVVTNGTPLWLQDSAWSQALRGCLEQWLGRKLTQTCGTDSASQRRYRDSLIAAGFDVDETSVDYTDEMNLEQLVGGVYSAFSVDQLPEPDQRPQFAEQVRRAVHPETRFREHIRVTMLTGRLRTPTAAPIPLGGRHDGDVDRDALGPRKVPKIWVNASVTSVTSGPSTPSNTMTPPASSAAGTLVRP